LGMLYEFRVGRPDDTLEMPEIGVELGLAEI
jgi:hypothetical protein